MAPKKKTSKNTVDFSADRPISSARADRLGRKAFADGLSARIQNWKGRDSLVIALCGEWGSGKTSLKNMVTENLMRGASPKVDLLEFHPWEISGHESVAACFFRELAILLGQDRQDSTAEATIQRLRKYSKAASFGATALKVVGKAMNVAGIPGGPVLVEIGGAASQAAELTSTGAEAQEASNKELSLASLKQLLSKDMAQLPRPILIVIDDIDRLTTAEIREVFQLVKANADFPNIIYLLMFDRKVVASALDSISGNRGHEFLDKIVQVLFHVPQPPTSSIHKVLFNGLDAYLTQAAVSERWDRSRWTRVWPDGLSVYYKNLRCVHRFLGSFGFHVSQMRNGNSFELNPLDLIILETLRLFEPSVYEALPSMRGALTQHRHFNAAINHGETMKKAESDITALLMLTVEPRRERLRDVLSMLFPVIFGNQYPDQQTLLRELRVGHADLFDRYFTMSLPTGDISQADLDALRSNFTNPAAFVSICESLKKRGLLELAFERLDAYKQDIQKSAFPKLITSLIQAVDIFPETDNLDFTSLDAHAHAYRLIYFGLRTIEDEIERYGLLCAGIKESTGVHLLVKILKFEERAPEKNSRDFLITEEHWHEIKPLVLQRIHYAANNGSLRKLNDLNDILWCWKEWEGEDVVKIWLSSQIKTGNDALWALKTFLSTTRCESDKVTYIRYLKLDLIAKFCSIESLTHYTKDYKLEKLAKDDMRALRAFRFALSWRVEGKPDNYRGENSKGDNPLEEDS